MGSPTNPEDFRRMELCRHLLPEPGGDVVGALLNDIATHTARIARLEAALRDVLCIAECYAVRSSDKETCVEARAELETPK